MKRSKGCSMAKDKLLIIDDEIGFSQMLVEYFKTHGYDVGVANNLEDAILLSKRQKPKVVLLDFNMPLVTGEQLLPILQSINPMIRVIVISGCLQQEVEEKFKGLGYFAFFDKGSLSLDRVRSKVDEAFGY